MNIKFVLERGAFAPTKVLATDAAFDIRAQVLTVVSARQTTRIPTGLYLNIPPGFYGQLETRSSMAVKGLIVTGGVIDAGYIGEIIVILNNTSQYDYVVAEGDKVAQLVIRAMVEVAFEQVAELPDTARGFNGFGSSGK